MIVETTALEQPTLERFYRTVLQPSIHAAELMTLEEICDAYLGPGAAPGALLVEDGEPVAGILAELYPVSRVLLIGYLAVHHSRRGRGNGTMLLAKTLPHWQASLQPALTIAEVDDPRFHTTDHKKGDPVARLRFYSRAGARLLAMPYFQPSLRPTFPRVRDMLLISFGIADDAVPRQVLVAFLREYFELCEGKVALTDPDVRTLLDWTGPDPERIALWPLDRFGDAPRLTSAMKPSQERDV